MPEDTQPSSGDTGKSHDENESTTLHTCACGEQHEENPGSTSHRESCTSPLKFGDTCCCGSGNTPNREQHRCGHGPRCR
ncbi:MAG: hypothetical protein M0Q92_04735 [Methanoregula sp.]|nr:hypothetical protein [Methanoregula sp.]